MAKIEYSHMDSGRNHWLMGVLVVVGTAAGMVGVIFYKIYRKIRFGISLYD